MDPTQPDVKLSLDEDGIIREASVSERFGEERVRDWIGQHWSDTVSDVGPAKVSSMLMAARAGGVSGFRQVNQRFPSGLEIPIEYTAVWLGAPNVAAVAIGKNLQAVTELQDRLLSVQEALEHDYWKLREVETRYRQLFEASNEAVMLVRADDLHVLEANPAAVRALGGYRRRAGLGQSRDLMSEIDAGEHAAVEAMLERAREQGKAPGVKVHLGARGLPWTLRASLLRSEDGPVFLLQLAPADIARIREELPAPSLIDTLVRRCPEGFVVTDTAGQIRSANPAFLVMAQVGTEAAVLGENLERWFVRDGADLKTVLATVAEHGVVPLFPTTLRGERGEKVRVELSAFNDREEGSECVGLLLREVQEQPETAGATDGLSLAIDDLTRQVGSTSMRTLVRNTVEVVERHIIRRALEKTAGNRTATAELLGLSRQGLYAKLARYGLESEGLGRHVPAE